MTAFPTDHVAPAEVAERSRAARADRARARTRTAAEEARTLVAQGRTAALATSSEDGSPWGSLVLYAALEDGTPVLCLSTLAEHGRNVTRDPRASLMVGESDVAGDPLDSGRVTLAGQLEGPQGEELHHARMAYKAASPASGLYGRFGDFTYYVLRIERVRWVGAMAGWTHRPRRIPRRRARPRRGGRGLRHRAPQRGPRDALLAMAHAFGGHPDATEAPCVRIDRYGLDLRCRPRADSPPRGWRSPRPAGAPGGLRAATVELARRARA